MTNENGEIKAFGITLKGAAAKQVISYVIMLSGWAVAVGAIGYSAWGPPARLNTRMIFLAQMMDSRLRSIEKKLKIDSPQPLQFSDAGRAPGSVGQ